MSALEQLQSELIIKLGEIDDIRKSYGYGGIPTLVMRHENGASQSMVFGNDSLGKVVFCIAELGEIGEESSQTPHEAILTLFKGQGDDGSDSTNKETD